MMGHLHGAGSSAPARPHAREERRHRRGHVQPHRRRDRQPYWNGHEFINSWEHGRQAQITWWGKAQPFEDIKGESPRSPQVTEDFFVEPIPVGLPRAR
jgi:hypothetical protein